MRQSTPAAPAFDSRLVREWIENDPDLLTREEITDLLGIAESDSDPDAAAAAAELADRFSGTLEFGTAGLRGAVAGGPNRMNRAVVIRAAAGLSRFLLDTVGRGFGVVIGYDARHGSLEFARDTAAVVAASGGRAMLLPGRLPTPVLAFSTRSIDADAGVMVTASHNPREDNGYKVYLGPGPLRAVYEELGEDVSLAHDGAGAQIVAPFDAMIAERIAAAPPAADVARADGGWEELGDEVLEGYLQSVAALPARQTAPLKIVHTSLHGVGDATARMALARCGFDDIVPVAEQAQPDPDFPTVEFPNPEESGALDAAERLASEVDADFIIANDPDADRFAAAVPSDGTWRRLSGDEVGLLLGERIAARLAQGPESERTRAVLASSIVSSRALASVAAAHGLRHAATLTGFKWISRVNGLVFGYEEALGYCVDPTAVKDKDGISAAVEFAALASELKAAGRTIDDELVRIRTRDGVFLTAPLTLRFTDLGLIARSVAAVLAAPPLELAGSPVVGVLDMSLGSDTLLPTTGVMLTTAADDRVVIRPSGTEPKLKCYLEVVERVAEEAAADGSVDAGYDAALDRARVRLTEISGELDELLGRIGA